MEEFCDVMEELSLVNVKTTKGWFTWVNNREGNNMVKERLDRYLISANAIDNFSFVETNMSDHDVIMLDTLGHKPRENFRAPRLLFKYDLCWAKEKDAKNVIKAAWNGNNMNTLEKLEKIDNLIDGSNRESKANMLKTSRIKLGHLYAKEESRIRWLKEGDKNTHFFYVCATERIKKNNIEKLKDSYGNWKHDKDEICKVVCEYFQNNF
ncbi:reverse transcriptase [Gossypium australe]|uniref:Reverse transcriptase n=1 Tax=Gossypium australe TaxID=47621 RepID=A0A5B6UYE9_9ROSI|nr:reverse transcriptase [Gossypium australe]